MKIKCVLSAFVALLSLLAACGPQAATETAIPPTEPTEPTTDPYAVNTAETTSTGAFVDVSHQDLTQGTVTLAKINAATDGWVVIHVEGSDGEPGPVIGQTQVPAGESTDVQVTIDASQATPKLFAMLHVDEGMKGTYEFPGADMPVKDGDTIVMQAFNQVLVLTFAPSVTAMEQAVVNGTVTIASVYMNMPGWVAIHTEVDGKSGPVIGYALLPAGESKDIKVEIDESQTTPKLFAMLHVDAGIVGTYEFPGDDVPILNDDVIVMIPFDLR